MSTDTSTSTTTVTPGRSTEPGWGPLIVLLSGTFLVVLDFFIVNVALPSVQRDLHAGSTGLEWLVAGYALSFGGLLLAASRLGDRWGRRRMFRWGLALFVAASAACGLAPTTEALIAARVAQGVSAAMLTPMVLALIGEVYDGPKRLRALGAYTTVMGFAAASGQLVGGLLIEADLFGSGWRGIFWINIPIGLAALALTRRLLPETVAAAPARVDVAEALLSVAALVAVMLPLLEGQRLDWPLWTWGMLGGSIVLMAAFVMRSRAVLRRGGQSLLDPTPFSTRAIRVGIVGQGVLFMGMASYFLVLALYLQQGHGLSPLESGLVFSILAVSYVVGTGQATGLLARFGRLTVVAGAAGFGLGHLLVMAATDEIGADGSVLWLAPGLVVSGLGMGLCLSGLVGVVMAAVEPRHTATVSGALSTVQQVGNALGVAVFGMVFFGRLDEGIVTAFDVTLVWLALATGVLALLALALPRRR